MMVASSMVIVMLPARDRHLEQESRAAHEETALRFTVSTRSNGGECCEEEEALWRAWRDCRHVVKQLQLVDGGLGGCSKAVEGLGAYVGANGGVVEKF